MGEAEGVVGDGEEAIGSWLPTGTHYLTTAGAVQPFQGNGLEQGGHVLLSTLLFHVGEQERLCSAVLLSCCG